MATVIDLSGGEIFIADKSRTAVRVTKVDVDSAKDEAAILEKLNIDAERDSQVYYFHFDTAFSGWECISGPRGLPRPQAADWPSVQREGRG